MHDTAAGRSCSKKVATQEPYEYSKGTLEKQFIKETTLCFTFAYKFLITLELLIQ